MALLELQGITKAFSGVRVLDGIELEVGAGEVHAIAGENGAGKSTLMNIISGVFPPDSGRMFWEGRRLRPRSPRDAMDLGIAFVHQELALVPQLSAAENVFLGRHPGTRGWERWSEVRERAGALFAELGHEIDPARPAGELSLAARQLVEIARALAFQARLIIMDEPTAPLSEQDAESLFRTILDLRGRGVSLLYITHRLKEIFRISDRVTVLRDGRRVLTRQTADSSEEEIVRAMVGSEFRRREGTAAARASGGEALRIEGPVSLTVRRGEIVGLAGCAGAGRTELLEWIFGAGGPYAGRLLLDGREVALRGPADAIRHGIALVADDRKAKGLVLNASLRDNIVLAGSRGGMFIRAAREAEAAGRLAGELRIRAAGLDQPVEHLSGGNQQKAVLAKWLYAGARVFLLDEPTRGIDVRSKGEIYDLVRRLAAQGAAILFASSEQEELLALAERIVVLHRGRVAGEFPRGEATEERIMQLATGGGY